MSLAWPNSWYLLEIIFPSFCSGWHFNFSKALVTSYSLPAIIILWIKCLHFRTWMLWHWIIPRLPFPHLRSLWVAESCQGFLCQWHEAELPCFPTPCWLKGNTSAVLWKRRHQSWTTEGTQISNRAKKISLWTSFSEVLSLIFQNHSIIILMLSFMWQSWVVSKDRIKRERHMKCAAVPHA